jgi:hypothetical protein
MQGWRNLKLAGISLIQFICFKWLGVRRYTCEALLPEDSDGFSSSVGIYLHAHHLDLAGALNGTLAEKKNLSGAKNRSMKNEDQLS